MRPIGYRVIVRRPEVGDAIGSIFIPEQYRDKPQEGEVIAVGEQVTDVVPGDRVLFSKYAHYVEVPGRPQEIVLLQDALMVVLE